MPKNIFLTSLANSISTVFSPISTFPFLFLVYLFFETQQNGLLAAFIVFGVGVFPGLFTLVLLKHFKKISDWNIRKREERYLFNTIAGIFGIVMVILLYLIREYALVKYMSIVLTWFVSFALITRFWKISAHSGSITIISLLVTQAFPGLFLVLLAIVFLTSWSRVYLAHHTVLQVVTGSFVSILVFLFAQIFFLM